MKKWMIFIVCLLVGVLIYLGGKLMKDNRTSVQQIVEEKYMNEDGLIHAYPYQSDSQYLSESIGLYMTYLLQVKDKNGFEEQYQQLVNHFLINTERNFFLRWEIRDDVSVNALIDDVRIIDVLLEASDAFDEKKYQKTAEDLLHSIHTNQMKDDLYADFYDWSLGIPASRLTFSYITPESLHLLPYMEKSENLLRKVASASVFFPEYNDIGTNDLVSMDEAHMVDQLIIALNLESIGQETAFKKWVVGEWREKQEIKGRYDKKTLKPTVPYESLAVYYYLYTYLIEIKQPKLAKEVKAKAVRIANEHDANQEHFFDFIHYQLLQLND